MHYPKTWTARAAALRAGIAILSAWQALPVSAQNVEVIEIECPSGTEPTYFGCQVPPRPGVNYVKNWGALSYIPERQEWVFSSGYPKEGQAKKAIASACKKDGTKCQPVLTFLNQCMAVARVDDPAMAAPGRDTVHNGSSYEEAQGRAVAACKSDWGATSCAVVATQCSINRIQG